MSDGNNEQLGKQPAADEETPSPSENENAPQPETGTPSESEVPAEPETDGAAEESDSAEAADETEEAASDDAGAFAEETDPLAATDEIAAADDASAADATEIMHQPEANTTQEGAETSPDDASDGKASSAKKAFPKQKAIRIAVAAAVAVGGIALIVNFAIPQFKYSQAESAFESGNYDAAISGFDELGDYSDAASRKTLAEQAKSYTEGASALAEQRYSDAIAAFEAAGDYEDAADQLTEAKNARAYEDADTNASKENWADAGKGFMNIQGYKDSTKRAADCAEQLIGAEDYGTAYNILRQLGGDYADRASYASDMSSKADQVTKAERDISNGSLADARDIYNGLPDDFSYKGTSVATRKSQLNAASGAIDVCGVYRSADPCQLDVTQTSKSTGAAYYWTGDGVNSNCQLKVTGKLNDDGSVTLSGTATFGRYTNFSINSSLLRGDFVSKDFSITTTGAPGDVPVDDETSLRYDGAWHLNWKTVVTNHDLYFNYTYTASYTYTR